MKVDKRTKEYKQKQKELSESKALKKESDTITLENLKTPSQGLGDTLEKVFKATGVKKIVDFFTDGKDCGCDERRKKLNEVFSYKAQCLEQKEYDFIKAYNKRHDEKKFSKEDVFQLSLIHQRVFKVRVPICSNCPSGVKNMNKVVVNLNKMVAIYDN